MFKIENSNINNKSIALMVNSSDIILNVGVLPLLPLTFLPSILCRFVMDYFNVLIFLEH